ncbi:diguanylate cyclase [Planococcus salinarum]|uniref:diguanylate cyclase n=1 Tax=Planococcus salinarum TaxID=622695 RepID=UPI000E3DE45E|nr:diguanylate cyclase [Planococcus salinarum]TAA67901.1 diguanylate cyclase [Planococcus salinarum]
MVPTNYKKMLANRMEQDFSKWQIQQNIEEREVYRFLHTLKGTAGTIGIMELSEFCGKQLEFFTEESTALLPVQSLKPLMETFTDFFTSEQPIIEEAARSSEIAPVKESFVLVIDADATFAASVKDSLEERGISVVIALDGKKGMEFFYTLQPQMVLLDRNLPDVDGFDLVTQIHEAAKNSFLPIAVISADDRIETQIQAMELGATDFLAKPLNMSFFVPYVNNRLRNQKEISQGTLYDELTGAGNRKYFNHVLLQMTALAEKMRTAFTLVLLDLDHFKAVNDNYGHCAGDEVLRIFSQLLMNTKRESDYFFRYGGEEFALILPDTKAQTASDLLDRIHSAFAETAFSFDDSEPFHVSFSAGISEYRQKQDALVSMADRALYQAKKNGRNQTLIYERAQDDFRRHLNIIIVDDDSLVRKLVSKQFSGWKPEEFDLRIEEYADGASFVESEWFKPEENYMILLDGIMPKMDGLEVLNHVRNHYPHENIIISMLTSRNSESDIVLALKSGADDYIVKPFYAQEVVARIQRLTMRMFK